MTALPSGTVVFLFSDVEGSTRAWERSSSAMAADLSRHDAALRRAIEGQGGFVFKTVGDAFCAAFETARAALVAAVSAQKSLAETAWSGAEPLRVRIALHAGEAEPRGGDYQGPALNRTARVLAAAHGGQILVTRVVRELLEGRVPEAFSLRDLGAFTLRDLPEPERLFQVEAPGLEETFPAPRAESRTARNFPAPPSALLGREHELATARELLRRPDVRLLTLTGPGGIGKTRLALDLAAELAEELPHGAVFVPLAPVRSPDLVIEAIARALGVRESAGRTFAAALHDELTQRPPLLVLDNFEQVLDAAPKIGELLSAVPDLRVLATSRAALRLRGERVLPLGPLELPPADAPPEQALRYPGVRLFVDRARGIRPDFRLTTENAAAVERLCRSLDGVPLALELAAGRVRLLTPEAMLRRLDSRLALLTGGPRDLPQRHQTLRAAIEWSHELLDPGEQRVFARLSVFAGGSSLEAALAVAAGSAADGDTLAQLESLVEKSLLRMEADEAEPRFTMLETIREYAAERLAAAGEVEDARDRHAEHFLELARTLAARVGTADEARALEGLEREHDNFRVALDWCGEAAGRATTGLRLGAAVWRAWHARGRLSYGRERLGRLLGAAPHAPPDVRAGALLGAGTLALFQGDGHAARGAFTEALELARGSAARDLETRILNNLGSLDLFQGRLESARFLLEESLRVAGEIGDSGYRAVALTNLATVARDSGDDERSSRLYAEALAIYEAHGDDRRASYVRLNLGGFAAGEGDLVRAAELLERALESARALDDRKLTAGALHRLGLVRVRAGDLRGAELLGSALELAGSMGVRMDVVLALEGVAETVARSGGGHPAARLFGVSERMREEIAFHLAERDRRELAPLLDALRARMGTDAFAAAWAAGRDLPEDEAVALAHATLAELRVPRVVPSRAGEPHAAVTARAGSGRKPA